MRPEGPRVKDPETGRSPHYPGGLNRRVDESPSAEETVVPHSGAAVLLAWTMEDGNLSPGTGKGKEMDPPLQTLEAIQPFHHLALDSLGLLTKRIRE